MTIAAKRQLASSNNHLIMVETTRSQRERKLCSGAAEQSGAAEHCFEPEEKDVVSPPTTAQLFTDPPTAAPTSDRNDPTNCVADGQGNYGNIDGPSSHTVQYRYQVETTDALTAFQLNVEVLQDVEKAISDRMVQRFFLEQCSPPIIDIFAIPNDSNVNTQSPPVVAELQRVANPFIGEGGLRKLLLRSLKGEEQKELVGLSADPIDQVFEGDEGGKFDCLMHCPYYNCRVPLHELIVKGRK